MRFRFSTETDLLMCKAVMETQAHTPAHNQKTRLMNETCVVFINCLPRRVRELYSDPKGKTLSDRFELIVKQRREENATNRAASGISEEQTELNILLDDLIHQRDEFDEVRRKENDKRTEKEKRLDTASKSIREHATKKMGGRRAQEEGSDGRQRKVRRVATVDSGDDEFELLKEIIEERRENERRRLEIESKRLEFERNEASERRAEAQRQNDIEHRRLEIKEGELALKRQEAMNDIAKSKMEVEEKKGLVSVLTGLAKKLG